MDKQLEQQLNIKRQELEANKKNFDAVVQAIKSIEPTVIKEDKELVEILKELAKSNSEPICVNLILE
jgi:flagellar motility protein MotE (MotC chaperone)